MKYISENAVIDQQVSSLMISTVGYVTLSIMLTPWLLLAPIFNLLAIYDMKRRIEKEAN